MSQIESGRPDGSRVSGIDSPTAKAEAVVRLLADLAERRPEVVNRLLGLLEVLADVPRTTVAAVPEPGQAVSELPAPLPLRLTEPVEIEDSLVGDSRIEESRVEGSPPPATTVDVPAARIVEAKPAREKPKAELTAKDKASLEALLSTHGPLARGGGLARATPVAAAASIGLWDVDAQSAQDLAKLARAQMRRLRKVRLAMRESKLPPEVDGVLNQACVTDWTADGAGISRLAPKDLKEGERWYRALTLSLVEVADWLARNSKTPLGAKPAPTELHERLQCVATAQRGVWCWIDANLGRIGLSSHMACGVQTAVYRQLVDRWTKDFRARLTHMMLSERVDTKDRTKVEAVLERFISESVEAPVTAVTLTESTGNAAEHEARFESVAEAFEAAERDFGGKLLVFTDAAAESAEDSAFKRPDEVYEFFAALRRISEARADGSRDGTPMEADFRQEGFTMKPCTQETMKRHRRHYYISFDGRKICISHHVTLGSKSQNTCISIHWWHDEENRRFVIGHCGKHLPNTLT